MFQPYLSEYSILEVETFRMYSYMIELSAHVRRRYGHMRVSLDGTSNFIFFFKFSFFFTCMGDPPMGDRWISEALNFLCVLYTPVPTTPVSMKV